MTDRRGAATLLWLWALLWATCLPNPQSVRERRQHFDREALADGTILKQVPPGAQPVGAVFGQSIQLAAYTLDPPRPQRGRVEVTFFWQVLKLADEDYKVFVHGDALEGRAPRIHGDHFPAGGRYPTDVWQVGEIVRDRFAIWIPPAYGARRMGIHAGLYKGSHRVPLTDGRPKRGGHDNRVRAMELTFDKP